MPRLAMEEIRGLTLGRAESARRDLLRQMVSADRAERRRLAPFLLALDGRIGHLRRSGPQTPATAPQSARRPHARPPLAERLASARAAVHGTPGDSLAIARARQIREAWGRA